MPTPLPTEAREALVTALNTTDYPVEPVVKPVPVAGRLYVLADDPWLSTSRLPATAFAVNLKVLAVARDNKDGLEQLEAMVMDALGAVTGLYTVGNVGSPKVYDLGAQGTVLVSEIPVTIQVKE
jgi:hypothetical protein